jgi:hypothetical protein
MTPRLRVIIDNDFAGDPDGLLQLAHHLLSPGGDPRGDRLRRAARRSVRPVRPLTPAPPGPPAIEYNLNIDLAAGQSFHDTVPAPEIGDDGFYVPRPDGRSIRVYTRIDNRLMLADLYAKLALHAGR